MSEMVLKWAFICPSVFQRMRPEVEAELYVLANKTEFKLPFMSTVYGWNFWEAY